MCALSCRRWSVDNRWLSQTELKRLDRYQLCGSTVFPNQRASFPGIGNLNVSSPNVTVNRSCERAHTSHAKWCARVSEGRLRGGGAGLKQLSLDGFENAPNCRREKKKNRKSQKPSGLCGVQWLLGSPPVPGNGGSGWRPWTANRTQVGRTPWTRSEGKVGAARSLRHVYGLPGLTINIGRSFCMTRS